MKIIIGSSIGSRENLRILKNNIEWFKKHEDIELDLMINMPKKIENLKAIFINKYKSISESRRALFEEMKSLKYDAYLILDPDIDLTINDVYTFVEKITNLKEEYDFINLSYTGDSPIPALFTLASSLNDLSRSQTINIKNKSYRQPSFYDLEIGKSEYQVFSKNKARHTSFEKAQYGIQVSRTIYRNTERIRTKDYVSGGAMVYFNPDIFNNYLKEWDPKNRWFDTANTKYLAKTFNYAKTDIQVGHHRFETKLPDIEEAIADINGMSIALGENRRLVLKQLLLALYYIKGYQTQFKFKFDIDTFIQRVKDEIMSFKKKELSFKEFKWIYNFNTRKGFANWKLPIRYSLKDRKVDELKEELNPKYDLMIKDDYVYIYKKICVSSAMFSYDLKTNYDSLLAYANHLHKRKQVKISIPVEMNANDAIDWLSNTNIEKNRFNALYLEKSTRLIDGGNEGIVYYSRIGNLMKSIKRTTTTSIHEYIKLHELTEVLCVPSDSISWAPKILNDNLGDDYTWRIEYEDIALPIFELNLNETITFMKEVIDSGYTIKDIKLGNLARSYKTNKVIFNDFGRSISKFDSKNPKHIEWTRSIIRQLFWIIHKKEFKNHCTKRKATVETCLINDIRFIEFENSILGNLNKVEVPRDLKDKYKKEFKCYKQKK